MSSRLRSLNSSKISFFAFQDIITAVSGILILVTLILATDLERPAQSSASDASGELARQVKEILRQQHDADAQNHRLQELLAAVETAPALEKLDADIARLRAELFEAQKEQSTLANEMAASQKNVEIQDEALGLTELKVGIQRIAQEMESVTRKEAGVHKEAKELELLVVRAQSRLLKLRQREGQLWLIPDESRTSKEPILVTVSSSGAVVERFDRPDDRLQLSLGDAPAQFESYLHKARVLDQHVVFLVRPSGIKLFQSLLKTARRQGFDVGFDALEEDREIHFSTPPPVDEAVPPASNQPSQKDAPSASNSTLPKSNAAPTAVPLATAKPSRPVPVPAAPAKSWWQKFLEFVGLR